jgi:hypothetical protein
MRESVSKVFEELIKVSNATIIDSETALIILKKLQKEFKSEL